MTGDGEPQRPTVVITGAAGGVGQALCPRLADEFNLRLVDRAPIPGSDGHDRLAADITDPVAMADVMRGANAVVHLAGNRFTTATWDELVEPNIVGAHTVLSAAHQAGVPRVVLASSCHASGRHDVERLERVDPTWTPRPCCPYGVSKVYAESVGRLLSETTGLQVIALRLGAVADKPHSPVTAQFWLSLGDLHRVVVGALRTNVRHGVYYAGSANVRERWNLEPGERDLGFVPVDDSVAIAHEIDHTITGPPCYAGAV